MHASARRLVYPCIWFSTLSLLSFSLASTRALSRSVRISLSHSVFPPPSLDLTFFHSRCPFNLLFPLSLLSLSRSLRTLTNMLGCSGGIGAAVPALFSLAGELAPSSCRGAVLSFVASFWVFGSVCAALLAWLIIPAGGWRAYVSLSAIPALANWAFCVACLKESPR